MKLEGLVGNEKVIYDTAFEQFAQGRTYRITPHVELAERLREEFAQAQLKGYHRWKKYPVGHYLREDIDEVLGLEDHD